VATLTYVDWFNNRRLHTEIGMVPPAEFEANYYRQNTPARWPVPKPPSLYETGRFTFGFERGVGTTTGSAGASRGPNSLRLFNDQRWRTPWRQTLRARLPG